MKVILQNRQVKPQYYPEFLFNLIGDGREQAKMKHPGHNITNLIGRLTLDPQTSFSVCTLLMAAIVTAKRWRTPHLSVLPFRDILFLSDSGVLIMKLRTLRLTSLPPTGAAALLHHLF
ncbi:hypothetical protein ANCDUO_05332 [Ancylostoma duodenale]|uniref:Uncharacterized protein n=1 Tax=Ancylostoma duodenale TaxID=51022 RepID=A0A0C2DNX2_9BILA|nr:hypothetical protein ANCDUO_05332 [Ancylostoma duodenale]